MKKNNCNVKTDNDGKSGWSVVRLKMFNVFEIQSNFVILNWTGLFKNFEVFKK